MQVLEACARPVVLRDPGRQLRKRIVRLPPHRRVRQQAQDALLTLFVDRAVGYHDFHENQPEPRRRAIHQHNVREKAGNIEIDPENPVQPVVAESPSTPCRFVIAFRGSSPWRTPSSRAPSRLLSAYQESWDDFGTFV